MNSVFPSQQNLRVAVDGVMSNSALVTSGVPRNVLGPSFFVVCINVLSAQVISKARLFADHCLLYRKISSRDDTVALQREFQEVGTRLVDGFYPGKMRSYKNTQKEENPGS